MSLSDYHLPKGIFNEQFKLGNSSFFEVPKSSRLSLKSDAIISGGTSTSLWPHHQGYRIRSF